MAEHELQAGMPAPRPDAPGTSSAAQNKLASSIPPPVRQRLQEWGQQAFNLGWIHAKVQPTQTLREADVSAAQRRTEPAAQNEEVVGHEPFDSAADAEHRAPEVGAALKPEAAHANS